MATTGTEVYPSRSHGPSPAGHEARDGRPIGEAGSRGTDREAVSEAIAPVRKAAIVLVSLDQSLASQLLSHLDRSAVEAVTWEIARLERVDPADRAAVLEEFYGLGLRRLCFVFDDLVKMADSDLHAAVHEEDLETWSLALAGAAAPVRAKVLAALSSGLASRLRRHLDRLGPFRLSDSEAAQLEIAERLRRLYDHGRISLPEPSGRDEVLVEAVGSGAGALARGDFGRGQEARETPVEDVAMARACRRRRALRAALGLAFMLALGFGADAVVLVTTHARADAAAVEKSRRSAFAGARDEPALSPARGESGPRQDGPRASRAALFRRLTKGARPGGPGSWSLLMIGVTLTLAVCGGVIAAGRRFLPRGPGVGVQVVGRVSLSPKHTVYMLQVGRRVLLVGAGPQGPPSLISELDELVEIEPDPPRGDQP